VLVFNRQKLKPFSRFIYGFREKPLFPYNITPLSAYKESTVKMSIKRMLMLVAS